MTEPPRRRARSLSELHELFGRLRDPDLIQQSIAAYRPRSSDVVISPFGKSGTTWTQQIVHTLRTRGDMDFDDISRVVPWIETAAFVGIDIEAEQRAEPRAFKSHLGYDKMPKGAKYIIVIRNPVDAAFSAFKFMEGWYIEPGTVSADEFVSMSIDGRGYQKHFVSWWPHRNDENVLYLVFEHMKQNPEAAIRRIATFIDRELDDELLEITREHTSLEFMLRHKDRFDDALMRRITEESVLPSGSDSSKVRAGQVGVHDLSNDTVAAIAQLWTEIIEPVTGFTSYEALIASLA